jgi:hypothetical protein
MKIKGSKNCLLCVFLFLSIACNRTKSNTAETSVSNEKNQFLTVDVTKEYQKSNRICLQDIAEVEYVILETNNDFLCGGDVSYIDNSTIIYRNRNGEILIFDRQGKAKHKINRKGQSGEEYAMVSQCLYDKDKNELYVNDMMLQKIFVYDIEGHYKRSLRHLFGTQYTRIYLFNEQYLLCYNDRTDGFEKEKYPFKTVSRQTGELVKVLDIPFSKRISTKYHFSEGDVGDVFFGYPQPEPAVKTGDKWILNEVSSDTIYQLAEDFSLTSVMAQIPSVQSMGENPKYLSFVMDSYHYQFMFIQKKEYDRKTQQGFPTTAVMYDKKTGQIFEQNFYDANRPDKVFEFYLNNKKQMAESNQYFDEYPAHVLKRFLGKGELSGRLKEIAEQIKEDDNPVLMIIKLKK